MDDWSDLLKPEHLIRRVTLDQYFAEYEGHVAKSVISDDRAQLEARAQPSDEWWEWVWGTESLRQIGGLALVRDGAIIWARDDWIS